MSSSHKVKRFSKSLAEKLGLRGGLRIFIVNPPRGYLNMLKSSTSDLVLARRLQGPLDFIHFFASERKELEQRFPTLKTELAQSGMLWISWAKGSSNVKTDLDENMVRDIGLSNGLIDVKVVAVDQVWSALKFVFRRKNRSGSV